MKAALRESPDVIAIGELREGETIKLALSASESGVLVLATLHANSAAQAVHRLLDSVDEQDRAPLHAAFSGEWQGIIAQQLVKDRRGDGRVPVFEVMRRTPQTAQLVHDEKVHLLEGSLAEGELPGAIPLDQSLLSAVNAGLVTLEDAARLAHDPERLAETVYARRTEELA